MSMTIQEWKEVGRREKRHLEKSGLLPNYDYPELDGGRHSPITVLNDNPGPTSYSPQLHSRIPGGTISSGRSHYSSQVRFLEDNCKVKADKDGRFLYGSSSDCKENEKVTESLYSSSYNSKAPRKENVAVEPREKIIQWKNLPNDLEHAPKYSFGLKSSPRFDMSSVGPGSYGIYRMRAVFHESPIYSLSSRHTEASIQRGPGPTYEIRTFHPESPEYSFGLNSKVRDHYMTDVGVIKS